MIVVIDFEGEVAMRRIMVAVWQKKRER